MALGVLLPSVAGGAELVVASISDLVNGDVSTPARLRAEPGPDGIALREAILAANAVAGPHLIRFADALGGATIALTSPLPRLERDGTILTGLVDPSGTPAVTLDASGIPSCSSLPAQPCNIPALTIAASNVSVQRLRFVRIQPTNRAILIYAGAIFNQPPAPQEIRDLHIEDCVFDNQDIETTSYAITLGMDALARNTTVRHVTIARNTFRHFQGDATTVHLQAHGERGLLENVAIYDNTFSECTFSVELVNVQGSGNTIRGTRIVRNLFQDGLEGQVTLLNQGRPNLPPATENLIARTLISENRFVGGRRWAIQINGGADNASGNLTEEVWIVNNLITRATQSGGGILVLGGDIGGAGNRVRGVNVVHNTIADNQNAAVVVAHNPGGAGNLVEGLEIRNNILWMNSGDFGADVEPSHTRSNLTGEPGFVGLNGNFAADPLFVATASLDYHLRPGSLAIDAGTGQPAVLRDLECRLRLGAPDLGALEFSSLPAECPSLLPVAPGSCAAQPTGLCLSEGRFQVEAFWRTPQGTSGAGQAVPLTSDTGHFWFFRSDNVEVIAKVLNACSFAPDPRFWTFAAGLTNVEVTLKVTDKQTGQVREYRNPLGKPFRPIQDTGAFATCP